MMTPIKTGEVFVPGKEPIYTYNPRETLNLEEKLRDYLDDGGSILVLLGPTKTGKTVLLDRVVDNPIWIDGQDVKSPENLWELIGNEIEAKLDTDVSESLSTTTSFSGKAKLLVTEGGGGTSDTDSQSFGSRYVSSIAPTVKDALLRAQRALVIDDFHFIDREVQKEIVRAVKPLVYRGLRSIFASITYRRHDVANAVEDMDGRMDLLETSAWSVQELIYIAQAGFRILNVEDSTGDLELNLAHMSFGSPHIMQQLCRDLVRTKNYIREARPTIQALVAPESWDEFFARAASDASRRWFTKLLRGPQEKGQKRTTWRLKGDGAGLDTYGLALKAMANCLPDLEITRDRIRVEIDNLVVGKPPEAHQVTRTLQYMSRIAATRLDNSQPSEDELDSRGENEDEFSGVQPVLEFIEDGPASTVHIADPFFAYYLKWGSASHFGNSN
ncbi:hypothetical protein [Brevibacterium sp. S111]|uniref:hypothetical protein n=1 Tax=Brevibacterium sp. S111 TaxID=2483795 RepID=UPI001081075C|nr:hypothetical protein [Brevibacterium sp. S111]